MNKTLKKIKQVLSSNQLRILCFLIVFFSYMIPFFTYAESDNTITSKNNTFFEYQYGDYYYNTNTEGEAILVYYAGNESVITLPNELDGHTLVEISTYAFEKTSSLVSLIIPGSVTRIDEEAFIQCPLLSEIIIEDGVMVIEEAAFCECTSLKTISIPNSVVSITGNPFVACDQLERIIIQDDHPVLTVADDVLFDKSFTRLISFPGGLNICSYSIPMGVKKIERYAFAFHPSISSVSIPDSVEIIDDYSFQFCDQLSNLILPDSILILGEGAFTECYNLSSVKMSNNILSIGDFSFSCCPLLRTLILPDSIQQIGNDHPFDDETITLIVSPGSYADQYLINARGTILRAGEDN